MFSVQLAAAAVAWSALPADMQAAVLGLAGVEPAHVPGIVGLLIVVARLIDQPSIRSAE